MSPSPAPAAADLSLFQLKTPAVRHDPYPLYQRLRTQEPVHYDAYTKCWVITRYADALAVLRHPHFSARRVVYSPEVLASLGLEALQPLHHILDQQMLFKDAPDHPRLRGVVQKLFAPRAMDALRPLVQRTVERLLEGRDDPERLEVMGELAFPLTATVIAHLLGVEPADHRQLMQWADDYTTVVSSFYPVGAARVLRSVADMAAFFAARVEDHRGHPGDDLIATLLEAEREGLLRDEEVVPYCILLLAAGLESTASFIGNAVLALLRHPAHLARLHAEPSAVAAVAAVVEELLRYDGPSQYISRQATRDVEIGGVRTAEGERVTVVLAAANRDPDAFGDPDDLRLCPHDPRHVAFGYGPHYCVGAALAQLESRIALGALIRRWPRMRLAPDASLEWREHVDLRGPRSLRIALR